MYRCIFPLSTTTEIYGCINSTDRWGSPSFRALSLLNAMSLKNVSTDRPHKKGEKVSVASILTVYNFMCSVDRDHDYLSVYLFNSTLLLYS